MNYCDKLRYDIHTVRPAYFLEMVDGLLSQLPGDRHLLRLVFFGASLDNDQYMSQRNVLYDRVREFCGDLLPAVSYVGQPTPGEGLVLEAHSLYVDEYDYIKYCNYRDTPYVVLENREGRFLFSGGIQGDILSSDIQEQSETVFDFMGSLMEREGFPVDSIVRQWNYIEDITGFDKGQQHYQMFNNVRADFYEGAIWSDGYPAATGIGSRNGGVLVDFDAVVFKRSGCYVTAIDNKLQIAAHAYSDRVLVFASGQKSTPKFERGKSLTFDSNSQIYISGTAAIRGEENVPAVNVEEQLHVTLENIKQLIGIARLKMLRVYLKDERFYAKVKSLLDAYHPGIPISYMQADVCRDELLLEIEGLALE
ncbi:endoribonuclease L-PSP [Bacteroides sp.]|uniref:chorismate transformation enzyme, FkbO/Hyg5 family n=1 Tax=Bacteroides sp. TaxID=29523 RepID=UPI0025C41988|nr:endoribonuclease L-PSP [Bacteroides sp.]